MMKLPILVCAAIAVAPLAAVPASAHHSFAMFDRGKTDSVAGTVKSFELINPHGWLQLMVADPQGKEREWSLETGGPGQMARAGWQLNSLNPGDKLTAQIHPLKDGSYGGQLVSVKLANGQTLGTR
jgi:hypothetical protein